MIVALTDEVTMSSINIQLTGLTYAIVIKAEKVNRNIPTGKLEIKDSQDKVIGEFDLGAVSGWWITP
ncbi:MAG: hypothetical protein ABSA78_13470 [Candidatus Sulfotelmatobacter sp.]|jgi:hypothetical protein